MSDVCGVYVLFLYGKIVFGQFGLVHVVYFQVFFLV